MLTGINFVSVIIAVVFLFPIIAAFFEPFTKEKIRNAFVAMLDNLEFLFSLLLSIYLTKKIFFENNDAVFGQIYGWIPDGIKQALYGRDVLTYIAAAPVILIAVLMVLRLLTIPLYRYFAIPLADWLFTAAASLGSGFMRVLNVLWSLPKSIITVLILSLALNFLTYYFPSPIISGWLNTSTPYQFIYNNALYPVLNSSLAKQIPVILNDSFARSLGKEIMDDVNSSSSDMVEKLKKGNIRVIEYFNGVTLEEAIKSSPEIDAAARKIVGNEKDDRKKGYVIYKWISKNMKYDYDKAVKVSKNPRGISSGSVIAFETRKGICFDYSCLYVSMCRAVGLKVRLVTGLGYSGVSWGDHAWNQVYYEKEKRWINLDTTFGTGGNYYDKPDFKVDHKYAEVQGEW